MSLVNGLLAPRGSGTTAWVEPTINAAWTIQGAPYEVPRYRKFMGIVFIEGLVLNNSGGALGPADGIFQLPVGMRPRATVNAVPFSDAGLEITSTGWVQVNNSIPNSTFLSLTISFVPDQ